MITFFNRCELARTSNLDQLEPLRRALTENGIDYLVRTEDQNNPSALSALARERHGIPGMNLQLHLQYILYVKRSDEEKALACVRMGGRW